MPKPQPAVQILALQHRLAHVAEQIHAVMMLAYAQEAALLAVRHFPPLDRQPADVQASAEFFLGALAPGAGTGDTQLQGVLSIGPDDEAGQLCISSLVVHPRAQRRGTGRALVLEALRRGPGMDFAVSTTAANGPALALYQGLGFVVYRHGSIGPQALPLLKLRLARKP